MRTVIRKRHLTQEQIAALVDDGTEQSAAIGESIADPLVEGMQAAYVVEILAEDTRIRSDYFVTADRAAELSGFSVAHVKRACTRGWLLAAKRDGRWWILEADIGRWVAAEPHPPRGPRGPIGPKTKRCDSAESAPQAKPAPETGSRPEDVTDASPEPRVHRMDLEMPLGGPPEQEPVEQAITSPHVFDGQPIRAHFDEDGTVWLVAKDVCAALTITWRGSRTLDGIPDDWQGVRQYVTPGGAQDLVVVRPEGAHLLVFRSRKPEAERFKLWLAGEVLPSIEKTGRYDVRDEVSADPVLGQLEAMMVVRQKQLEHDQALADLRTRVDRQEQLVEEYLPNRLRDHEKLAVQVAELVGWSSEQHKPHAQAVLAAAREWGFERRGLIVPRLFHDKAKAKHFDVLAFTAEGAVAFAREVDARYRDDEWTVETKARTFRVHRKSRCPGCLALDRTAA